MPIAIDDNAGSSPHTHPASDVISGTLLVVRGGTGLSAVGAADTVLKTNTGATANEYADLTNASITSGVFSNITGVGVQTQALNMNGQDIDNIQRGIEDLSVSTTAINFAQDQLQTISIAANTTFTGTGYAIGLSKTLYITTDATLRTLTFPAGWVFQGAKPADQAASKVGVLTLTSTTAVEAGVRCAYAVQA